MSDDDGRGELRYSISRYDSNDQSTDIIAISSKSIEEVKKDIEDAIDKYYPRGWDDGKWNRSYIGWYDEDNHSERATANDKYGDYYLYSIELFTTNGYDLLGLAP